MYWQVFLHRHCCRALIGIAVFAAATIGLAGMVPLTASNAGTENTTLVTNGGFETNVGDFDPFPAGWGRFGDMFVTSSGIINGYASDQAFVARAHIDGGAAASGYVRSVAGLTPGASYVLSGYLWNFGDATHNVLANLDLNDELLPATDPQSSVLYTDPGAATGVFVYQSFVAPLDGDVTVRAFYDGRVGGNTGWPQQPVAAQWDNIAITLASEFSAPVPEPASLAVWSLVGLTLGGASWWRRRRRM